MRMLHALGVLPWLAGVPSFAQLPTDTLPGLNSTTSPGPKFGTVLDAASRKPAEAPHPPPLADARTATSGTIPPKGSGPNSPPPSSLASPSGPSKGPLLDRTPHSPDPPAQATAEFQQQQPFDLTPGRQIFPLDQKDAPLFTVDDELILQLRIRGFDSADTLIAYGSREALYLPFGELTRILDLAIRISDDGHYASGWFLDEERKLTIDLRQRELRTAKGNRPLDRADAMAFEGELYLRSEIIADILPIKVEPNLRSQAILLTTLEPFPFEERLRREMERAKLGKRRTPNEAERWTRQETPWLPISVPMGDIELRPISDSTKGARLEGDLRLSGDIAYLTGQSYFSASTQDGLVSSLIQIGRRDVDGDLLGPLAATEFQLGDVATASMPVGLRGRAGRGGFVTNRPFESASVFEQIDLRGILPSGYEVELYRNDILIGSVANAPNGQYEFLEIPVDYGLNVFRFVFYGPQGQRREEVRRVSVGDGRLSSGKLEYDFGAIQRGENLLGVHGPDFRPTEGYGRWQAAGRVSYGLSEEFTALASLAFFDEDDDGGFIGTASLRSGVGGLALRADAALSDGGSYAVGLGTGGRLLGGAFALSHFEYGGGFIDELRSNNRDPLSRATELDLNTTVKIGGATKTVIPVAARLRNIEYFDGRSDMRALLRGSARFSGLVVSNNLEYLRASNRDGDGFSQLGGSFDLTTFRRSRTQARASVGYRLMPGAELTNVAAEIDRQIDDRTVVNGRASYSFNGGGLGLGASSIREFDRFSVAFDGNYGFGLKNYSAAIRLGFSFGRDPLTGEFFLARPGQASSGGVSLRAFQDMDGDSVFSDGDIALENVGFTVSNNVGATRADGTTRLTHLGHGNRATVQVDPTTLPDILMVPVERGIEFVPRAGRFHVMDFPIVAQSEIEGTVSFRGNSRGRGVSGLRLVLVDGTGKVGGNARSERGGYFFFEEIKPGSYELVIDRGQAERLGICMADAAPVTVGPEGSIQSLEIEVHECAQQM